MLNNKQMVFLKGFAVYTIILESLILGIAYLCEGTFVDYIARNLLVNAIVMFLPCTGILIGFHTSIGATCIVAFYMYIHMHIYYNVKSFEASMPIDYIYMISAALFYIIWTTATAKITRFLCPTFRVFGNAVK